MKYFLRIVAGGICLGGLFLFNLNFYKSYIEETLSKAIHKKVRIEGDIGLSFQSFLGFQINEIVIEFPQDSKFVPSSFLSIKKGVVQFYIGPLLLGNIKLKNIFLEDIDMSSLQALHKIKFLQMKHLTFLFEKASSPTETIVVQGSLKHETFPMGLSFETHVPSFQWFKDQSLEDIVSTLKIPLSMEGHVYWKNIFWNVMVRSRAKEFCQMERFDDKRDAEETNLGAVCFYVHLQSKPMEGRVANIIAKQKDSVKEKTMDIQGKLHIDFESFQETVFKGEPEQFLEGFKEIESSFFIKGEGMNWFADSRGNKKVQQSNALCSIEREKDIQLYSQGMFHASFKEGVVLDNIDFWMSFFSEKQEISRLAVKGAIDKDEFYFLDLTSDFSFNIQQLKALQVRDTQDLLDISLFLEDINVNNVLVKGKDFLNISVNESEDPLFNTLRFGKNIRGTVDFKITASNICSEIPKKMVFSVNTQGQLQFLNKGVRFQSPLIGKFDVFENTVDLKDLSVQMDGALDYIKDKNIKIQGSVFIKNFVVKEFLPLGVRKLLPIDPLHMALHWTGEGEDFCSYQKSLKHEISLEGGTSLWMQPLLRIFQQGLKTFLNHDTHKC